MGWESPQKNLRISGFPAEIRTDDLPNTSLERYSYANSLSETNVLFRTLLRGILRSLLLKLPALRIDKIGWNNSELHSIGFDDGPSECNSHALRAEHACFVPFIKVIRAPKRGPSFTVFITLLQHCRILKLIGEKRHDEIYFCDIFMLHTLLCSFAFPSVTIKTVNLLTTVAFRRTRSCKYQYLQLHENDIIHTSSMVNCVLLYTIIRRTCVFGFFWYNIK
jgi:uncharacterized protein with PQ loop repeat